MNGNKANILGVAIDSSSAGSLLNTIVGLAGVSVIASPDGHRDEAISFGVKKDKKGIASSQTPRNDSLVVFTPNPEFIVEAQADPEFKILLNKADINLPDGIGLVWAGKLLGQPVKQRISGADVVEKLLEAGNGNQESVNSH